MIARLETLRMIRSRRPLVAALALLFFLAMMLLGFYTYADAETSGGVDFRYTFENRSYFNGLTFALYAFYFGFLLLLPIFASVEGGAQIAGDTHSNAILIYLTRPLSRARIFFTKLLLSTGLLASITFAFLLVSMLIGLLAVGWGRLDLYPGVLQMTDRPQHLTQAEALLRFALAWPAASIALLVPLSMSFLISTWSRNPVNAVGVSVSLYLILYVISEIHFFKDLRPWLFTSYLPYWRELFQEHIEWSKLGDSAARLLGFAFLFLALAWRRFRRREER